MTIFDRQGQSVTTIPLPGLCTSLSWDKEGEHLAITQDFNGKCSAYLHLNKIITRSVVHVEF